MDIDDIEEIGNIIFDGVAFAACKECGHEQEVEPDAEYPCPECKVGKLVSPLIELGLI